MKKMLWTALLMTLTLTFVSAQTTKHKTVTQKNTETEEPETRAKKLSEDIKRNLKLTVDETERIYNVFLDQFKKERLQKDKDNVEASLKKASDATDAKIRDILGEIKYANYKTMRKDNLNEARKPKDSDKK